jgi:hypothetical protein
MLFASTGENEFIKIEQKGLRERLLCQKCETKLSAWEKYAHQVMYRTDSFTVTEEHRRTVIKGIDFGKFKLFQLSLLWRASVASGPMFAEVNLGPHEERLQKMLLNSDPGEPYDYPCVFLAVPEMPTILERSITSPQHYRHQGCHGYRFTVGKMFILFMVSKMAKNLIVPASILSLDGELPILKDIEGSMIPLIKQMFASLASSDKLRAATEDTEQ